jgi:hypothetical protein
MNLALFDVEGTITASGTWTPFMRVAVRPSRMRLPMVVLAPVIAGYNVRLPWSSRGRQAASFHVKGTVKPRKNRACSGTS